MLEVRVYLVEQVFSEHEQAPTPLKSFSSISEVSMTFRSKVLSRTKKYDGQTDGRKPQTYRPPTFWVGA